MNYLRYILALLFIGAVSTSCSQSERFASGPVERTNVGNGGDDVVAEFGRQLERTLEKMENSVEAEAFATTNDVSLVALRELFGTGKIVITSSDDRLFDKNGKLVVARVAKDSAQPPSLEIFAPFWREQFEHSIPNEELLAHELMRLLPGKPGSFDDDYYISRQLVAKSVKTELRSDSLSRMKLQVGSLGCDASRVALTSPHPRTFTLHFFYVKPVASSRSITPVSGICDLRVSVSLDEFTVPQRMRAELSVSLERWNEVDRPFSMEMFSSEKGIFSFEENIPSLHGSRLAVRAVSSLQKVDFGKAQTFSLQTISSRDVRPRTIDFRLE